jgi:hypothetical protein
LYSQLRYGYTYTQKKNYLLVPICRDWKSVGCRHVVVVPDVARKLLDFSRCVVIDFVHVVKVIASPRRHEKKGDMVDNNDL